MKPSLKERLRARFFRGRERAGALPGQDPRRERQVKEEKPSEFSPEELEEFLAADGQPDQADPAFKEALRERLWAALEERRGRKGEPPVH
jgi:hypothetical protein